MSTMEYFIGAFLNIWETGSASLKYTTRIIIQINLTYDITWKYDKLDSSSNDFLIFHYDFK